MMLIGLLLFVVIVYLLFNQKATNTISKTLGTKDPLEIAKVRLAKGEISVEEFEMIKKTVL